MSNEDTLPGFGEEEELLEESQYSKKSEFSKAFISQSQVSRCLELRSKDMRPGYTSWVLDKSGTPKPQIIPDSRKEFISAVEALMRLLAPEIKIKNPAIITDYEKELEDLFEKYAYNEKDFKYWSKENPDRALWHYTGRKFIPHKGAVLLADDPKAPKSLNVLKVPGMWDQKLDAYWDERLEFADQLFSMLNELIHDNEYFMGGFGI